MEESNQSFFFAFRGGKEIGLVKGDGENPNEWDFPSGIVKGENPVPEAIERILKEKHFRDILIDKLKKVVPQELGDEAKHLFGDSRLYMFAVIRAQSIGLGRVFFVRRVKPGSGLDCLNAYGLPDLSERARLVLESPFVQSRL